jgi:GMP synthase (glutamine-hydrolysing)
MKNYDQIAILDFGSQYTQLITRRIRECQVYSEIFPHNTPAEKLKAIPNLKGLILSGGPASTYEPGAPQPDPKIWELGIPILGICYGLQLMSLHFGGKVEHKTKREYGKTELFINDNLDLFAGLLIEMTVWMSHGDVVTEPPLNFKVLATSPNSPVAAMADKVKKIYGVQFHPEVTHTPMGKEIIKNFLYQICGAKPNWTIKSFIEETVQSLKEQIKGQKILCALSGGVDSTTTAMLVNKAVGKQLTCMFIDQGFMRKDEAERIVYLFEKYFKINLVHINASRRFYQKLASVTDPEKKRQIIGNEFIRVFEEEAKKLGDIPFLAQGTLYPDVIESAVPGKVSDAAAKIKTHHNVGGLPLDIKFQLIEPLKKLFKDEVRHVGKELNIPDEIVLRQPFPGPGLAIRVIGEVTPERVRTLQEADFIVIDEIKSAGLYYQLWQTFAVLLPIRTVGVMGDKRTYLNTLALRAVTSSDGMTADWAPLPYEVLAKISNRIINEVPEINRVVYDISSKPPATIEWE